MRVYHFVDSKFGLEDVAKRRLKIARIDELNDPFELLAASCTTGHDRAAWRGLKADCAKQFGLLCFSKGWRNPVQWSHYGDRHTGLCLGFDVQDHNVKAVKYVSNRLPFDRDLVLNNQQAGEAYLEDILSTKFSHWRYEREVRMFVRLDHSSRQDGLFFYNFSNELSLTEVIVGSLSSVSRDQVREALGSLSLKVLSRKARLAFRSFQVVEQRGQGGW